MENHYFKPPNIALSTIGLALATFMQVLDTTIANVSLPTIAGNLGVGVDQSTWVVTSFAVSLAISLPLTGFLVRRYGEVSVFIWSTFLFVLASFACGMSRNMEELIFFRVVQGAVCGPIYPVTQSLMIAIYPPMKRGMALALISMVTVVAPVVGPILGGWISEDYSWRWIFFINIPVGLFCSIVVRNQLRTKPEKTDKPRMDYMGLLLLVVGVGLLQIVLDKGNDVDWFNARFIIGASVVSAIALLVFVIWELTDKTPIVDLKLFRFNNFSAGTIVFVLGFAGFFSIALLVPLWLQRNLGYTAILAGLATAPVGVIPILTAYFIGCYATKIDLRYLASLSFLSMGCVCFLYSRYDLNVSFYHVVTAQIFLGVGVTCFFMPVLTILLSDLQGNDVSSGSGLATFLRTVGGSFAVSLVTFLWTHRASLHHAQLVEHITPYNPNVTQLLGAVGEENYPQAMLLINNEITQQSFQLAFNEVFYGLAWLFWLLIIVVWFAKPPFIGQGMKAEH